ncbi:MAG TPA: ABC transporter permease [Chloroflexota bacterium]|nr:ABC transporter permease [Chloroflexota bacterium]
MHATGAVVTEKAADGKSPLRGRRRRVGAWLQLAPASLYFLVFFVAPITVLIGLSFYSVRNFDFVPELTLENYWEVITSSTLRAFFARTLRIAAIISVIVVLVSYPFAYIISYVMPRRRQLLYFLVLVSLFGGYLVRIYAWRNILGRAGVLNQSLIGMGVVDEPIRFFLNSPFAIVITSVNFLIPLGVLPIFSSMQNISPRLIEAARDLGSSQIHAALKVVLPLSMRGVSAAFAFSFIAAAAEWVTPAMVGGTGDQMVGNQIAFQFGGGLNWPLGAALAISLVFVVVAILSALLAGVRWISR